MAGTYAFEKEGIGGVSRLNSLRDSTGQRAKPANGLTESWKT
jgi:hypothetical protein